MTLTSLKSANTVVRSNASLLDWKKNIKKVRISVSPNVALEYFLIHDRGENKNVTIKLARGASLNLYGIFVSAAGDQRADIQVEHAQPNSTSFMSLKGVFTGNARGVINGTIHIHKAAQGSSARLEERVLLLSPLASAKTIPNLEIEANDVKASHAATVSRLNEDEIFYLQTRGLSRDQSIALLIETFIASQVTSLPDARFRSALIKNFQNVLQMARERV